ncbi:MAG TPA: Ig-like domain-containing protein, partial [Polyangia bacterium]
AGTTAGNYTVGASVAGVATSAIFALTNLAGTAVDVVVVSGSGQTATVSESFAAGLVAQVTDAHGNGVAGVAVGFVAPTAGATAVLSAASVVTGSDGRAAITATANMVAGSYTVQATAGAASTTFTLTNAAAVATELVIASGDGQSTPVGTPFVASLAVRALDSHGNPVPGVAITFNAPASGATAALNATAPATDAAGYASVTAIANGTAGSYVVTATATGVASALSFTLSNVEGPGATIEVVNGNGQTTSVTQAFATALVAVVKDAAGNPVRNTPVTFQAPSNGARATLSASTVITDNTGRAQVDAVAGVIAGSYLVTASVSGVATAAQFALTNRAGPPAAIAAAVASQGQAAQLGQPFTAPLVVTVTDSHGNPVGGIDVGFSAPAAGASAILSGATATTGPDGRAQVTATAANQLGSYVVTAQVAGLGSNATFALSNLVGAPATVVVVSGGNASAAASAGFAAPLVVLVRDAAGNAVPNTLVHFAAPTGQPTAVVSASDVLTDATGHAQTSVTAGTKAGSYDVVAQVTGAAAVAVFPLTNTAGAATKLVATATSSNQTAQVRAAFVQPLEVSVLDAHDNPVAGVTVSFAAPTDGATATLDATTSQSDANGHASARATAGSVTGAFAVTASAVGIAPATFALQAVSGAPAVLSITSGSPQTAVVGQPFAAPLVVQLRDGYGNPVANADVTFSVPSTGATAVVPAAVVKTNALGRAETLVTAGTTVGGYDVTASAQGVATSAAFALTNSTGPAALITTDPASTPQSARVTTAYAAPLRLRVSDAFGNPVANATVAFVAPASEPTAVLSAALSITDLEGRAAVQATASTGAGTYEVRASIAGASVAAATFTLTNTAQGANVLTVVSGGGQSTRAGTTFADPVVLSVRDHLGNPVAGAVVEAAAPTSGPSATITSAASDSLGQARLMLAANGSPGVFTVTASVAGAGTPASFTMTITAIPTTTTLEITPDTATANDSTVMNVTVTAAAGTPEGVVRFVAESRTLGMATLQRDGTLTVQIQLPPPGTYQVTAVFDQQGSFGASTSAPRRLTVLEDTGRLTGGGGGCSFAPAGSGGGSFALFTLVALGWVVRTLRRRSRAHSTPRGGIPLTLVALLMGSSTFAQAQPVGGVALGRLNPAPADSDWMALDSVSIHGHNTAAARVLLDSAHNPFVVSNADGSKRNVVVAQQLLLHISGVFTLRDRYRFALDIPVSPYQDGNDGRYNGYDIKAPGPGLGTMSLAADARVLGHSGGQARLALGAAIGLPTGQKSQLLSDGKISAEPRIAIAAEDGFLAVAARGSILLRPEAQFAGTTFGNELRGAVSIGLRFLAPRLLLGPEVISAYDLSAGRAGTEWLFGVRHAVTSSWTLGAGVGRGISSALGTPSTRVTASVAWVPPVPAPHAAETNEPRDLAQRPTRRE